LRSRAALRSPGGMSTSAARRFGTRSRSPPMRLIFGDATFGLPTFVRYALKHTSPQSCSVHGAFMSKVWPFVADRVIPLKELRWSRTMLTSPSPRTVREISHSSVLAEQGRLIAFPNVAPERGAERLTLRHTWQPWTSFRLGWTLSSLGACLGRKMRAAAPNASPGVVCARCRDPAHLKVQAGEGRSRGHALATNLSRPPCWRQSGF
jgi:hypothetical protein